MEQARKLVVPLCGALMLSLLAGLLIILGTQEEDDSLDGCTPGGDSVTVASSPAHPVGRWSADQVRNAAAVVNAGAKLHVPAKGQQIAVMTAIAESSLTVVDHGDGAGPDSRGLFQQRAVGWGSYAQRMDPAGSASSFYHALLKVPGWQSMSPTQAAHTVQRNADPGYYTKYYNQAVDLLDALTNAQGRDVAQAGAQAGAQGGAQGGGAQQVSQQVSATTTSSTGSGGTAGIPSLGLDTAECGSASGSAFGLNPGGYVGPFSAPVLKARAQKFVAAGGTDPFFGSVHSGWYRICQHFVANMSGRSSSGYGTAADAWAHFSAMGTAHPANGVDGNAPPAGAWLYYNGGGAAGHVAIYLGGGMVASNDVFGNGKIGIGPATAITEDKWHLNYLGWAAPWGAKVPVLRPSDASMAAAPAGTTTGTTTGTTSAIGAGGVVANSAPVSGSGGGGQFRMATFNVLGQYHTGPRGDQHKSWRDGRVRIRQAAQILTNSGASVAGLQEFERVQAGAFTQAVHGTWTGWYPGNDTRNAIVWRPDTWSLVQVAQLPIPYINRNLPMPAVKLQLNTTGAQAWFVNVHNPSNMYGRFAGQRTTALRRERVAIARLASTGTPVFLTGDFNDKDPAICAFRGLLDNAFTPGRNTCHLGRGERIDHIMGRGARFSATTANHTPERYQVSDHPISYTNVTLG